MAHNLTQLQPTVAETTRLALLLHALLAEADEAQWQPAARRIIDTEEENDYNGGSLQSRGQHADPTFDITADELRLELRRAVRNAEYVLASYQSDAAEAVTRLRRSLDRWNGRL